MENWYTIYRCNPRQMPGTHGTGTPIVIFGDKPGTDVQLFPDIMQLVQETGTHIVLQIQCNWYAKQVHI